MMPASLSEFERLFLLEFFVDYVNIQNSSFDNVNSTLCVSFQFLHYPVMRVCEEDFTPKTRPLQNDSKIIFKSGKSCLFSVHSDENNKIPSQFNLVIAVCQKKGCSNQRHLIGQATVNLGSSFMNLLQPPPDAAVPKTGVRHDLFALKDTAGKVIGSIAAFARISCFGKLIVTQFQLAAEDEMNYMFKGTDVDNLFKGECGLGKPNIDNIPDDGLVKDTPYDEIFGYPKESEDEGESITKFEEHIEEEDGEESIKKLPEDLENKDDEKDKDDDDDKSHYKNQEEENYKEIGAEVNGHSIVIRVLKKRKKPKKSEDTTIQQTVGCCCPQEPPICPYAPKLNVCSCDYPLPPELITRCPVQCCSPAANYPPVRKPISSSMQAKGSFPKQNISISSCPREDCPLNQPIAASSTQQIVEPGTVAMKGDQVFFQPTNKPGEPINEKEKKIANSLYYKTNCNENQKNGGQAGDTLSNNSKIDPNNQPITGRPSTEKHKKKKK